MLVRIVKMSIDPERVSDFLDNFNTHKLEIRNFSGCRLLELYRDKQAYNVFFTYSYWTSEADLEKYRDSDLFKLVWSKTKLLFNDKPQAWSVDKLVSLE
jgi:quinol monooxygenase YgiN